jgi:hypothetical protein
MVKEMVLEKIFGLQVSSMKVNGRIIKEMEKARALNQTVKSK